MLSDDFTKNQLPDVTLDRERSWGHRVVNRACYQQWRALACRLGMTESYVDHLKTLRSWMETSGPVASTGRGIVREARPGPSRSRVYDEMDGRSRPTERSVRGRYDRGQSRSRSGSRTRGSSSSLNRGQSGGRQYRTRDDY